MPRVTADMYQPFYVAAPRYEKVPDIFSKADLNLRVGIGTEIADFQKIATGIVR